MLLKKQIHSAPGSPVARIIEDRVILDLRTVRLDEESIVVAAFAELISSTSALPALRRQLPSS